MAAVIQCDRCPTTGTPAKGNPGEGPRLPEGWVSVTIGINDTAMPSRMDLCAPCYKRVAEVLAPVTRPNTPRTRSASTTDDDKAVHVGVLDARQPVFEGTPTVVVSQAEGVGNAETVTVPPDDPTVVPPDGERTRRGKS